MALDRGTLAKIDRRVFAEFGSTVATQAVKVPLSDAMWSTWRRYCQAVGLTMGEGISGLIDHELRTSIRELPGEGNPVFARQAEERLAARESEIASREGDIEEAEERLSGWTQRLRAWEGELRALEKRNLVAVSQFEADIAWLAAEEITVECNPEGTLYCPNDSVTWGQMAAFLHRALG